jgi:hypothetical protein
MAKVIPNVSGIVLKMIRSIVSQENKRKSFRKFSGTCEAEADMYLSCSPRTFRIQSAVSKLAYPRVHGDGRVDREGHGHFHDGRIRRAVVDL